MKCKIKIIYLYNKNKIMELGLRLVKVRENSWIYREIIINFLKKKTIIIYYFRTLVKNSQTRSLFNKIQYNNKFSNNNNNNNNFLRIYLIFVQIEELKN
jgi:hypothetical protein